MTPPRKETIDALFHEARGVPFDGRAAHLDAACGGDAALRAEVEALLAAEERAGGLEPPTNEDLAGWLRRADRLVGRRVGDCTLVRRLAGGGMGVVYLAEQDEPKRTVAVKLLRAALATDDMRARFRDEVRALGGLTHPAIAQIFAAGTYEAEALPYFVMEYVPDARSLTTYCEEEGNDGEARLKLFLRVCDAVHFGHLEGVVHRDLKPDNILVGADGRPKVIDFGIARVADPGDGPPRELTRTGEVFGTLHYLSPEQLAGDPRRVDARSDVYSLGVVLYELLTGRLPYEVEGRDLLGVARVIAERPARFPAVGGDLDVVLGKALAKEAHRRYASVAAFRDDLRRVLAGRPVEARPPSVGYQLRLLARRHKGAVAAGSIAVLALLAGTVVSLVLAARARGEARRAERAAERARTAEEDALHEAGRARVAEREAVAEAARARALWLESQRVTNTVAGELFDRIAYLPGSLGAREYLATWLEGALDRLARHVGDDPALRRVAARRWIRLGEIHGMHGIPNLGNTKEARAATERALELLADGGGVELAVARARAADLAFRSGDADAAAALEAKAREGLEAADRTDPRVRRNLVLLDVNSALRLSARNDYPAAIAALERAVAHGRALVAAAPDRAVHHLMLSRAQGLLGQRLVVTRDYDKAASVLDAALATLAAVEGRLPPEALDGPRALLRYYLGDLHFFQRRPARAQPEYERCVAHLRALVAREPRDRRARDNLAAALARAAMTHVILGSARHKHPLDEEAAGDDPAKLAALEHYRAAVAFEREQVRTLEELCALDPENLERVYGLHEAYAGYANALAQVRDWTGATAWFAKAETLARELRERQPRSVRAVLAAFTVHQRRWMMRTLRAVDEADPAAVLSVLEAAYEDGATALALLEELDAAGRLPAHLKRLVGALKAGLHETEQNLVRAKARLASPSD